MFGEVASACSSGPIRSAKVNGPIMRRCRKGSSRRTMAEPTVRCRGSMRSSIADESTAGATAQPASIFAVRGGSRCPVPVTRFLTLDEVIAIAVQQFGSPLPIRDVGLLDSAVARPATTVLGHGAYPDRWTKATALLQSLVGNHALIDGNKRLGWTATFVFVALNSAVDAASVDLDDAYDVVIDVASDSSLTVDAIAARLRVLLAH